MLICSSHFGDIEVKEEQIIDFYEGILGFEEVHKFALLDTEDPESPFKWIQCVDRPELAFALINPFAVKKDYDFEIRDEIADTLHIEDASHVLVFSIVVVPEDSAKISMNLKAPIILNTRNKKAVQVVLDTDKYTVRHYILDELRRQEG